MSAARKPSLLESLEGKRGQVRAKPPLPAHKGLFGKPTVINNVISLATVPMILADGADAYHAISAWAARAAPCRSSSPATSAMAGLFETAFGVTLGELVDDIGGGTADRPAGARGAGRRPAGRLFPAARCSTRRSTTRRSPRATG